MSNSPTPPNSPGSSGARLPAATVIGHPPQPGTPQPPPDPQHPPQNYPPPGAYPQQGAQPGHPQQAAYPQQGAQPGYPQQAAYPQQGAQPGHPQQAAYPQPPYPQQPSHMQHAVPTQPALPSVDVPPAEPLYPQQPSLIPEPQASISQQSLPRPVAPTIPKTTPPRSRPPSRPAPAAPPFRPSRNPLVRLLLWVTEPSMIKGMAMGVILALVISVAFRLEAMWFIASSVLTLLITCLFGVLIGHYVFENRRKKLQRRGVELLRQAGGELPGISERLVNLAWTRDRTNLPELWDRLARIKPAVEEIAGLSIAALFRVMAMSTLFAVLGGAISFAVFLTSYMQVERMDAQNKLISEQIGQTKAQMDFAELSQQIDVALSIAERRQVTIRELLTVVNNDGKPGADKRTLSPTTAGLIAVAVDQLDPYVGVTVDRNTGKNAMSPLVKSPEQEQLLRYLSAARVDFQGIDLSRAFLDHTDLHGIDLEMAVLPRVRMQQVQLYDAKLAGADMGGVDLTLAALARADLTGTNLAVANLHKANLVDANFTQANLVQADLSAAIATQAVFKQALLGGAVLHGARLGKCDLTTADIATADIATADLAEAALPAVPKVRAAAFWWLGVYSPDYAAKLGLAPDAQQRNKTAFDRIHATPPLDRAAITAVVDELKAAAPNPPA